MSIEIIGETRLKLRTCIKKKPYRKRPLIRYDLDIHRIWLPLDNQNSFPVSNSAPKGELKGEAFRFYIVLLQLASKFRNPFNYSDKEFIENYKFHKSRIPEYKDKLEQLGLIEVARVQVPKLQWPKSHYLIKEFNDEGTYNF